ncbi:MAG: hypothetical protein MZV70_49445 [Desulfobacterales bacterium]|nr:hypothetical protein [Desulfobacterales bacterium]
MDKDNGPAVSVTYRITANGSVVLETLFPGTDHEMLTLYHLDNDRLGLTHYCAMGNQPRMELDPSSPPIAWFLFSPAAPISMQAKTCTCTGPHRPGRPGAPGERVGHPSSTEKIDTKQFFLERKK